MSPRNKELILDHIAQLELKAAMRASAATLPHWLRFDSWQSSPANYSSASSEVIHPAMPLFMSWWHRVESYWAASFSRYQGRFTLLDVCPTGP